MFDFTKLYEEKSDDPLSSSSLRAALPLKQRTSSIDVRKDYSTETWRSLLHMVSPREFFITVNNFSIFSRHISWAISNGGDLRNYITQRYASNMVFMSLLLGAELGVLFNSAQITTGVRHSMENGAHHKLQFWIGISVLLSIVFTILSLFTTFTAWGMVSAISDENAHCMLRSSIGQYVVQLPQRFIIMSIYSFFFIFVLFLSLLLPAFGFWSVLLTTFFVGLFFHAVTVFSAFGRLILHTGAIAPNRIFDEHYEQSLLPQSLHSNLIKRARAELTNKTSVVRQYRRNCKPIDHEMSQEEMIRHIRGAQIMPRRTLPSLGGRQQHKQKEIATSTHKRADSSVRFADQLFSFNPSSSAQNLAATDELDTETTFNDSSMPPERERSEEDAFTAVEEGLSSASSSQADEEDLLSRDKEKNWFSSIASSVHKNPKAFADPPKHYDASTNASHALPPKGPSRRNHKRTDSKIKFARDSVLETTTLFSPESAPINIASRKKPEGVLKTSKFASRGNSFDEAPALPVVETHTSTAREDKRNWFSSIASSINQPMPFPSVPKATADDQGSSAVEFSATSSQDTAGADDAERANEQQKLLGSNTHGRYSSVGR